MRTLKTQLNAMLLVLVLGMGFANRATPADPPKEEGLGLWTAKDIPLKHGEAVAFLGDSITEAGAAPRGYCRLIAEAITQHHPALQIKSIYSGVSGNTVPGLQARLDRDVLDKKPTLVFIYIGVNDVWGSLYGKGTRKKEYEAGLRDLVKRIQAAGALAVLATPSVIGEKTDGSNSLDPMLDEYAKLSRKVAAENSVVVCDLHAFFRDYLKEHNPQNTDHGVLTSDGVHLNDAGNRFVADRASKAIINALRLPNREKR